MNGCFDSLVWLVLFSFIVNWLPVHWLFGSRFTGYLVAGSLTIFVAGLLVAGYLAIFVAGSLAILLLVHW